MKLSVLSMAISLLGLSGIALAQQDANSLNPASPMQDHWGFVDQYCAECHNFEDWAGSLVLEGLGADSIVSEPEIWEEVIRKLNAGMMPPTGQPRPDAREQEAFVTALETSLDNAVALNPNPGSVQLHRLNRTEYARAIKDIFDLDIDPAELLPRDNESYGFDNNANVLGVTPSFLEQYVLAAREVSIRVMGKPGAAPVGRVYPGAPEASQNMHIDGLPLGTRGGMLVEHFFPADGEYEFSISGLVGAGYVWGVMDENTVIITVDGEKVFEESVGGTEDLRAVDLEQAAGIAAIDERFSNIRRFVKSGHHKVGITFLARSAAVSIEPLHGFVPVDGMATLVQGVSGGPRISSVTIRGPYNAEGVSSSPSREKVFICYPEQRGNDQASEEELTCARQILGNIARQAFRRPITEQDLSGAMEFFEQGRVSAGFDEGIQKGIMAILASPKFLYRAHTPPMDIEPGTSFAINDVELASRLSFFLWSQQPDRELLALAVDGRLSEPDTFAQQIRRMLADPRAEALVSNFAFQWLHVSGLEQVDPDKTLFPQFTYDLVPAFEKELALFIGEIFSEDQPITNLLDGRYTYLNERLALHYGLNNVRGGQFQRVELDDPQRWGLLGKGAILMATSYANRTSPVLRGAYVLEKLIGSPPPSPPPDVEAFPETEEGGVQLTVRERLESHRSNAACMSCHAVIDPIGLALENYNAIGQWRDKDRDAGIVIDASGQLAEGTAVASPAELSAALLNNPSRFAQTFTEKLMTFALGRGLEYYDMPTVRSIVRDAAEQDYRLSAIVMGIVNSPAFRMERYNSENEDSTQSLVLKTLEE